MFGGSNEIIEDILLFCERTRLVPALSVLTTTAEIRDRIHATSFQPNQPRRRKTGRHGDVEAAVSVQISRITTVKRNSFFRRHEHWNACAILAREEHLLRLVSALIEVDFGLTQDLAPLILETVAVDGGRLEKRSEAVENFPVAALAAQATNGSDSRQGELLERTAGPEKIARRR
jgi:hypothetical protein